jgi:hypothetical protein
MGGMGGLWRWCWTGCELRADWRKVAAVTDGRCCGRVEPDSPIAVRNLQKNPIAWISDLRADNATTGQARLPLQPRDDVPVHVCR